MRAGLGEDFRRLWWAYTASETGSAIGYGALPLVAVLILHASAAEVSLLAAIPGLVGALLALPVGDLVEFRAKRPVLITADVVRFVALGSVPVAIVLSVVSLPQLYVVSVVQTVALVAFTAAGGAHLRALVGTRQRAEAASRFEVAGWTVNSAGPPLGGVLVSAVGPAVTTLIDAISYLASALGVRSIRRPEPPPPARSGSRHFGRDLLVGWRYLLRHRELALLFGNGVLFGSAVLAGAPLETVLMLDDLGFGPWQYGLVIGLPCLGGLVGARLAPRLSHRFGTRRVLLWAGAARSPWLLVIPFVGRGFGGMVTYLLTSTALLLAAGVFNPLFSAHRMNIVREDMLARVLGSWSIGSRLVRPVFVAAAGGLASLTGVRAAIGVAGVVCVLSVPLLFVRTGTARHADPFAA
ncbi:MFS transporter [Amycolatopsis sp. FDAARGOS 1241]|uniref:MFS transporter n=1 Tax=Amycolatopsis sp. FDAARGOS 1241 TaxID=2778070 RepID=UPI00194FE5BE|nr:MFS transporter [Amycolatopsis sp. FDAARGOS 1241]QRP50311.1 MFS transporter [Amycolatopsis sp. FDAARGOS 1241]